MNGSSNNRKLLIFTSIFLLIISSFVMASFGLSSGYTSLSGEPTENELGTIDIVNNYPFHNVTDLSYTFTPNSALSSSSLNSESLRLSSFPSHLDNGSGPTAVNFEFEIPQGLDAIDDNFDEVTWTVGTLEISGEAKNLSNLTDHNYSEPIFETLDFNVQVENHLEFYNGEVEFEISGEDPINTSSGRTRTVEDGDRITIRVFYENTFSEDIAFNKEDIEAILYVDEVRQDTQEGKNKVERDEFGELELEFDVEDFDTGESYDVEIELTGITDYNSGNGGKHGDTLSFKIDVEEAVEESTFVGDSDGDGVNDDLDLCPNTNILCISDEAGCEMDPDNDGICNGVDRTPNGEVKEEQQITQNTISKQDDDIPEPEEVEEKVVKKDNEGSGTGSFFFGLIVGFIGAALFFTLTKV